MSTITCLWRWVHLLVWILFVFQGPKTQSCVHIWRWAPRAGAASSFYCRESVERLHLIPSQIPAVHVCASLKHWQPEMFRVYLYAGIRCGFNGQSSSDKCIVESHREAVMGFSLQFNIHCLCIQSIAVCLSVCLSFPLLALVTDYSHTV